MCEKRGVEADWGSSPQVRGKNERPRPTTGRTRDHPRRCGEKIRSSTANTFPKGSSPRVRGKVHVGRRRGLGMGIIPAGAGKSSSALAWGMKVWDHPAGAGKSGARLGLGGCARDHPRGCGEKPPSSASMDEPSGSSPRVRGKAIGEDCDGGGAGIIPAGAGRRPPGSERSPAARDHPRGCGEKLSTPASVSASRGSSPRVRGEEGFGIVKRDAVRIIPAGAGRRCRSGRPP